MNKKHTLYIEKFRPDTLEHYLGSEELLEKCNKWIKDNDIPHLLFAGSVGLGKSTLAKILVKKLNCDYLWLNASDENCIDTIREKVKSFSSAASFTPLKVVILEEASYLTKPAQEALKAMIEEYSLNTRFILTANYLGKITAGLRSRCDLFEFKGVSKGELAKHIVEYILEPEGIKYDNTNLVQLINSCYPDIRATVKHVQRCINNDELKFVPINDDLGKDIVKILQKPTNKSWAEIRQLVNNANLDDYQYVIEYLYDNLESFSKGKEAEIIIELDEAQWRSNMVADKEINFAALISKILILLK